MNATAESSTSRRAFVRLSILGALGASMPLGCSNPGASPPNSILSTSQRATLAAVADRLVPGAVAAGVVEFVSAMLAEPDPMLCYRFVSFPLPPVAFYTASLDAIEDLSRATLAKPTHELAPIEFQRLIGNILSPHPSGWHGPPGSLVYFVIRNDAIDAVYGGEDAYARLGIPYMAHIKPPGRW